MTYAHSVPAKWLSGATYYCSHHLLHPTGPPSWRPTPTSLLLLHLSKETKWEKDMSYRHNNGNKQSTERKGDVKKKRWKDSEGENKLDTVKSLAMSCWTVHSAAAKFGSRLLSVFIFRACSLPWIRWIIRYVNWEQERKREGWSIGSMNNNTCHTHSTTAPSHNNRIHKEFTINMLQSACSLQLCSCAVSA